MKFVLLGFLSLLIFAGTIAAALFMTGNLNRDTLDRVVSGEVEMEEGAAAAQPAEIGPVAEGLRQKEQDLAARENTIAERERRLETRMQEMQALQTRIEEMQAEMDATMSDADTARLQKIRAQAVAISAMKPENAARLLESFPADEAAEILFATDAADKPVIDQRAQSKIMDALQPDFATLLLRAHKDMGR